MSPEAGPILVFDGVCILCCGSAQFVLRRDRNKVYRFATTQSPCGRALLLAHGLDPRCPLSVLLIDAAGASHTESAAMLHVLSDLGGAWRVLAWGLRIVPRPIRDAGYRWVARHRYRWFGRRENCYLPDSADAGRFLH